MIGSSTADENCGWSERYQVYLKKNVYWPDIPDYIDYSLNLAKQSVPHQLMGYNEYKMESAVGWVGRQPSTSSPSRLTTRPLHRPTSLLLQPIPTATLQVAEGQV
jgi:hypothetical protein